MTDTLKTYTPIDGSLYLERPYAQEFEAELALNKTYTAQKAWQLISIEERAEYCTRAIEAMLYHKEEIALELCWQMGRPIRYALGELAGFEERARAMIAHAQQALAPIHLPKKDGFIRYIKREPLGVVLVIAPWNYPFLTAVNAIIPALMAGNTVILKHSAQTPLVAERFDEAFKMARLPKGVFQYLHLKHQAVAQLIRSPMIASVAFTGSTEGGEEIEKAAVGRFIHVGLELGGKDPAYIRADADIDHAVETVMDGAFFNSGQSCCGIERIYVHEAVYDAFIEKAVRLVNQYQLGRPDDPNTTLGPMVRAKSADKVRAQIQEAIEQGAVAHINPDDFKMDKPGTPYMAPQLLTKVHHGMRIMTEESFGPVVGVMSVHHDEEAIELMNDSAYGLTAAVFTRDIEQGIAIGEQLQTGTFFINRCDYLDPDLAWTGVKNSGRGCTLSLMGYESLTRPKSFHLKTDL